MSDALQQNRTSRTLAQAYLEIWTIKFPHHTVLDMADCRKPILCGEMLKKNRSYIEEIENLEMYVNVWPLYLCKCYLMFTVVKV